MFVFFLKFLATVVLQQLSAPKPQAQNTTPGTLSDIDFVTATDRQIQKLYGTIKVKSANVAWYDNLRTTPIIQSQSGGWFSSDIESEIGHKYTIDIVFMIGFGEIDELQKISIDGKEVWSGSVKEGSFSFNKPTLFGEEDKEGGVSGDVEFYCGSDTQLPSAFMQSQIPDFPSYKGISYIVIKNFYVGNSTQVKSIDFDLKANPKSTNGSTDYVDINGEANPAYILYDYIKDGRAFMGLPDTFVDLESIENAAQKFHAENFGLSYLIDSPRTVENLINEVERHVDCKLVEDSSSGKFRLKPIRNDYVIDELPKLTVKNTKRIKNFSRGSITKKQSSYKVRFNDRNRNYTERYESAVNLGVRHAKLVDETTTADYMCITNAELAQQIAKRELRAVSMDIASCTAIVNRSFWNINIGDAVVLEWEPLGIESVVFRVLDVNLGKLDSGDITLKLTQDIFGLPSNQYVNDVEITDNLAKLPVPSDNVLVLEAPKFVTKSHNESAVIVLAGASSLDELGYSIVGRQTGESTYYNLGSSSSCTPHGLIEATSMNDNTITIKNSIFGRLDRLQNRSPQEVRNGANICYIEDVSKGKSEWISFENVTYNNDSDTYTISNLHRGLLHTVARDHDANIRIWFVVYGYIVTQRNFDKGKFAYIKPLMKNITGKLLQEDVSHVAENFDGDSERPIPPGAIEFNGSPATNGIDVTNGLLIEVSTRLEDPGFIVEYNEENDLIANNVTYEVKCHKINGFVLEKELVNNEIQLNSVDFASVGSGEFEIRLYAKNDHGYSMQYHSFTATRSII